MGRKWFAGAVVWKREDGILYLLVQESKSIDPKYVHSGWRTKFPGGTNDEYPMERNTAETLFREFLSETGWRIRDDAVLRTIFRTYKPHLKEFVLIPHTVCEGELRKDIIIDGKDILRPPKWVKAYILLGCREGSDGIYRTHRQVLRAALRDRSLAA